MANAKLQTETGGSIRLNSRYSCLSPRLLHLGWKWPSKINIKVCVKMSGYLTRTLSLSLNTLYIHPDGIAVKPYLHYPVCPVSSYASLPIDKPGTCLQRRSVIWFNDSWVPNLGTYFIILPLRSSSYL